MPVKPIFLAMILVAINLLSLPLAGASENLAGLRYWEEIDKEIVETESGLQYKVLIEGSGRPSKKSRKVKVHYRGILLNGVVFDSSYDDDEPVEMSLKTVIKGWQEGIPLMPTGSVYVFLIPPELAYGENGSGTIPPNSTLIFEVELFR